MAPQEVLLCRKSWLGHSEVLYRLLEIPRMMAAPTYKRLAFPPPIMRLHSASAVVAIDIKRYKTLLWTTYCERRKRVFVVWHRSLDSFRHCVFINIFKISPNFCTNPRLNPGSSLKAGTLCDFWPPSSSLPVIHCSESCFFLSRGMEPYKRRGI